MWKLTCISLLTLTFFTTLSLTYETNLTEDTNLETRQARILTIVGDRRMPVHKLKPRPATYAHYSRRHYQQSPPAVVPLKKRPPMVRRVHSPYAFETVKGTRYASTSTSTAPYSSPTNMHREFVPHPNALSPNFKASPYVSGHAIIRPVYELLAEAQQQAVQNNMKLPIQQHPLPQESVRKVPTAGNYLNQQEQFISQTPQHRYQTGSNYYEQPKTYAVYEEPEHVTAVKFSNAAEAKEALEFIQFMGSDAYFLPKSEPDFRLIDEQRDREIYQQQLQYYKQKQQEELLEHDLGYSKPTYKSATLPRSSTLKQASYQTGKNTFVVNSDGNKAVKHIVSSTPHTLRTVVEHAQYTPPAVRRRTPEPVRFEFTERDVIVPNYTSSPSTIRYSYGPSTAHPPTTHNIASTLKSSAVGSVYYHTNNAHDTEDEDDIRQVHTSILGRVPLSSTTVQSGISSTPPTEQKDTEDYCERVCSNIQDDDEEIICGSDGYMYTSESQMECYGSCLHLDVTITGKGSCTAR